MHKSQSLFYLTTALHISGVTITHLQEHKTAVTTVSEQLLDKINYVTCASSWNYKLEYYYDARTHEREI
jgi:hypothetical protein